jgi:beta-N-acetylhexosaminidase
VDALRRTVDRADAPVLIDQEGGRVQRLGPPHWPTYPPGRAYGRMAGNDPLVRRELTRLGARLMAHDLHQLGINVDCVPVLDVPVPGAHDVIGDRAYASDPQSIAIMGRAAAEGMIAGGVLPVIKHIPGHGRAGADSHLDLPVVDTPRAELSRTDFVPFRHLADMPLAMTAHVVYSAIDPKRPATTSAKVIRDVIRGEIGYDGLVMSDDLSMKALAGDFGDRTRASLRAGCDVVLHCNGDMAEMKPIAAATPALKGRARRRAEAALRRISHAPEPFDPVEGRARLDAALAAIA